MVKRADANDDDDDNTHDHNDDDAAAAAACCVGAQRGVWMRAHVERSCWLRDVGHEGSIALTGLM